MTPEMQIIEQLLAWLIITGFITGCFLSGFAYKLCESIYRIWRIYRFKMRRKKLAERVSTSESGNQNNETSSF